MSYECKILADSVSVDEHRLTSLQVTLPRIVLAEINTHRQFCLAGDTELEFDLPAGSSSGKFRRVYRMRLDEFVDKWLHGARRLGANPKREVDLSWVEDDKEYTSHEIAAELGMAHASNIHRACRDGVFPSAEKRGSGDDRAWYIRGQDIRAWRTSVPEHTRFDMRSKLGAMRIRQLNETTGDIQLAAVINVAESGIKPVYELAAGEFTVAGSADHMIFTPEGYRRLGDLVAHDEIIVRRFGKSEDEHLDPTRLRRFDGVWRSAWQQEEAKRLRAEDLTCRRCREAPGRVIHHIVPVYQDPTRVFDRTNITFLCEPCHQHAHRKQDWQGGTYLYGAVARVTDIRLRGAEPTYDLEISGAFPNFLANGIVVHNSRSSASSRAIPVAKQIERVCDDPFVPIHWGKNQKGMQAEEELTEDQQNMAMAWWLDARDEAVNGAERLAGLGQRGLGSPPQFAVHKQITNRLLEPWMFHTVIVSATEWANFFALRCHKDAQPELRKAAEMIREVMAVSTPKELEPGEWHLPMVDRDDEVEQGPRIREVSLMRDGTLDPLITRPADPLTLPKISAGRCARVSYLTHEGKRDPLADIALCERLLVSGHYSPLEHPARAYTKDEREVASAVAAKMVEASDSMFCTADRRLHYQELARAAWFCGNYQGFRQLRKTIPGEGVFTGGGTP